MTVELSSALRTNLASLQKTQNLIDETQKRLATGLKVSSALDNPQNFFAAQGLDNRANDLSRLLDGIGQSVSALQQANTTIESLTGLLDQADSIASSAKEAADESSSVAKVVGNADLRGITDVAGELSGIDAGATLTFSLTDADGESVDFTTPGTDNQVTIAAGESIETVVTNINNIRDEDGNAVLKASLNDESGLEIESLAGGDLRIAAAAGTPGGSVTGETVLNSLGFSDLDVEAQANAADTEEYAITIKASATLESNVFYNGTSGEIATASTSLSAITDEATGGSNLFSGDDDDSIILGVNGQTVVDLGNINDLTIQDLVDKINGDSNLNEDIRANYDDKTGKISITALHSDVDSIQIGAENGAEANTAGGTAGADDAVVNFGFGFKETTAAGAVNAGANDDNRSTENIAFGGSGGNIVQLEDDYNVVREQIDKLIQDAGYRGTNLLAGDDLETTFNEDRTNTLVTEGVNFTSAGLGIEEASFANIDSIKESISQVAKAISSVRNFGSSIANDLTIIETRQSFTQNTIATLQEGADKLTQADTNEEGANLLALQTRQQLGTTALSLASRSEQAVLGLF